MSSSINSLCSTTTDSRAGGILGNQTTNSETFTKYTYNKATITGQNSIGGIV